MNERQGEALDRVTLRWEGIISTHYEYCWLNHAPCLAHLLLDLEEEGE